MDVISLEEGRVILKTDVVLKKSTENEFNNLRNAYNETRKLTGIVVPKVYDYVDGIIYMERLYGDNLELLLRNQTTHDFGVKKINYLLSYFLLNGFFWSDFAPRNILVDGSNYMIFDFERGFRTNLSDKRLFLINNVYEEYSAFLLPEERIYSIDDIFQTSTNDTININEITSQRVKKILLLLGFTENVPLSAYVFAIKMIVQNEEPYVKNKEIVFPLLELEEFMKLNGKEEYARRIIGGYYARIRKI